MTDQAAFEKWHLQERKQTAVRSAIPGHTEHYVSLSVATDWEAWQAALKHAQQAVKPFQQRVQPWMMECFGPEIAADSQERNHRFLEESLELVQACGATKSEAHQLVDYVYGRAVGDTHQEAGGVMVTLAALCLAQGLDMHRAGEDELARIWTKVEKIRAKQAAKPKHSPLPMAVVSERDNALQSIREAVEQYNQDLHDRKHGGVAMDKAWWKIIASLGALKSQQPAQADKDKP